MNSKVFLVTRPNFDPATHYIYHWSEVVIAEAKKKQMLVLDIKGKDVTHKTLLSYSKKHKPALILFNAHGSDTEIFGHLNETLIDLDTKDISFINAIVYARSCNSAAKLGPVLVKNGIKTFIGYSQEFAICQTNQKISNPVGDNIAKLFLEPSNIIPVSLIKGNTAKQSHLKSIEMMKKNLYHMLSSKATLEERNSASFLWRNMKYQTVIGDNQAQI